MERKTDIAERLTAKFASMDEKRKQNLAAQFASSESTTESKETTTEKQPTNLLDCLREFV